MEMSALLGVMAGPGARLVENTGPISVCGEAQSLDSLECAIVVTLHTNTQPAQAANNVISM